MIKRGVISTSRNEGYVSSSSVFHMEWGANVQSRVIMMINVQSGLSMRVG